MQYTRKEYNTKPLEIITSVTTAGEPYKENELTALDKERREMLLLRTTETKRSNNTFED